MEFQDRACSNRIAQRGSGRNFDNPFRPFPAREPRFALHVGLSREIAGSAGYNPKEGNILTNQSAYSQNEF